MLDGRRSPILKKDKATRYKSACDGRRSPILKKDEATRYKSACMRLSYPAQDRLDLAETTKRLAQRMSEPREFDFVPLKRAARYLVGRPKAALRYRRQKHVDKITVFMDIDFTGDPVSRKSSTGLVDLIGNHTVKSGSTLQSLTALSVGEADFYAVVKGGQVGVALRSTYQEGAYSEELRKCWNEASLCFCKRGRRHKTGAKCFVHKECCLLGTVVCKLRNRCFQFFSPLSVLLSV